jgi:DNA polymerase-3 subunit gamma/tau
MTQALYNKWRPQKWEEIIGQQHIVQTLRNAVISNRVVHAYLFAGPRGTGKTTAARLLAKAVNCLDEDLTSRPCNQCAHCLAVNENRFLDLIEIDAASQTGVDDVRDLRDKVNFTPNKGRYKIYIFDEVHMFSNNAFNALLKTLEEPPPHAIFILATTEIHKIPATVLSRCQRHEFRRLPVNDIVHQLQNIAKSENLTVDTEAMLLIARQSAGGMRDAISLLDQMASTGKEITLGMTQTVLGTATNQTVIELITAVLEREPAEGMNTIHTALDAGTDPRQLARQVVDYLRVLLLLQMGNSTLVDLVPETRTQAEMHRQSFSTPDVLRMIKNFNIAATDMRGGWQPSLQLELALAEVLKAPELSPQKQEGRETLFQKSVPSNMEKALPKEKVESSVPRFAEQTKVEKKESLPEGQKESPDTLDQVSKAWKQIKDSLKPKHPTLEGLLNSCRPLEIKDGVLVLGCSSEFVRSRMESPSNMDLTCNAITKTMGSELKILCVISNAKQPTPSNVKADGMVAAALKKGGEIVDIQE